MNFFERLKEISPTPKDTSGAYGMFNNVKQGRVEVLDDGYLVCFFTYSALVQLCEMQEDDLKSLIVRSPYPKDKFLADFFYPFHTIVGYLQKHGLFRESQENVK